MRELHLKIDQGGKIVNYRILAMCQSDEQIVRASLERILAKDDRATLPVRAARTMDSEFEIAELIELHDAAVIIRPQNYSDAVAGWREYPDEGATFSLVGESVKRLCEHFGFSLPGFTYPAVGKDGKSRQVREQIENHRFPLLQRDPLMVGREENGRWIEQLSARVISWDLLEILVKWGFKSDPGPEFEEVRITYSGRFTVWWSAAAPPFMPDEVAGEGQH